MVQIVNLGNTQAVGSNHVGGNIHRKAELADMAMSTIRYGDEQAGIFSKVFGGIKSAISWFFGGIKSILMNWVLCGLCSSEGNSGLFSEMSVVEAKASHQQMKKLINELKDFKDQSGFQPAWWRDQFKSLPEAVQKALVREYMLALANLKGLKGEEVTEYANQALLITEEVEKAKRFVCDLQVARALNGKPDLRPLDDAHLPRYLSNVLKALGQRANS